MRNFKHGFYKGKRLPNGNYNRDALNPCVSKFNGDRAPICKFNRCGQRLSPTEYLFAEYCFKHQQLINNAMYKALLFKWNDNTNLWEKPRLIILTKDQFYATHRAVQSSSGFFYRYDLLLDDTFHSSFYSINPSEFD